MTRKKKKSRKQKQNLQQNFAWTTTLQEISNELHYFWQNGGGKRGRENEKGECEEMEGKRKFASFMLFGYEGIY